MIVHREYQQPGWHTDAPWWGHNIRRRFGMRHVPLADLFTAFLAAVSRSSRSSSHRATRSRSPW